MVQAVAGSSPVAHLHEAAAQDVFSVSRTFDSARVELPMSYQFFGGTGDIELVSLVSASESGAPRKRLSSGTGLGPYGSSPQRSIFGLLAEFRRMHEAWPCSSSSGRSVTADGEDRAMAQTDQAWDWGVELRDEERSELESCADRRAASHATRSGARGAQKLQTARSGRKPGTQAARRSRAMAPP